MAVLVPMPEGVILHPRKIADWRYWWACVKVSWRRRGWRGLRAAIYTANHGTSHKGQRYRQCYRLRWLEP